ncbi:MAG: alpha-N-acetylglucosaminidase [Hungatella sp.]|nr:alpha-N-acetylglucosaminidase [Hungatella sp.]
MTAKHGCEGIVRRLLGEPYCRWFLFQEKPGEKEYYSIGEEDGRVKIQGSSGVAMAAGLNFYLRHFCHVYLGQQTVQNRMPSGIVLPGEPIERKAFSTLRYAYNYCTHSYTMPFWDEERWQRELDWLALCGVNLVLDITGMEEVWYRFLDALGYTDEEIRRWIVGPCYGAWQQMQNMEQFGGPVPRQFFADRAALARKNQQWMRDMGMAVVRQGYGGMVPSWHGTKHEGAPVCAQGQWNGLVRPAMLDTASREYQDCAALFYRIQDQVFGTGSHYYAADVFHEGGIRPRSLTDDRIGQIVLETMLKHDSEAVWVVQAWRENPTGELLSGIARAGKEHALILDLSATDNPEWKKSEFEGTPWVWCMLDMYGGRVATHGEADVLAREIPLARKHSEHMRGIGFVSEATLHNPVVYDLLFDMAWEAEPADLNRWLKTWLTARYGRFEEKAFLAWQMLFETAYRDPGYSHHGGYTQIFTFRPRMDMAYGEIFNELNSSVIKKPYYDEGKFEEAVLLLAETGEAFWQEESWRLDMQDLLRQVLNNRACVLALEEKDAWEAGRREEQRRKADAFLALLDACDSLMSIRKDTSLAGWLEYAAKAGRPYGREAEELFVRDAKTLITVWAGEETYGSLADYAYRQYGGLLKRYYRPRWERFFGEQRDIPVSKWYELAMEFVMEKEKADTAKDMEAADAARVIGRIVSLLQDNGETRE